MAEFSSPLWTPEDIVKASRGKLFGRPVASFGCAIDSRDVGQGDLFIAIRGETTDGHYFIKDAVRQGASQIILDHWTSDCLLPHDHLQDVSFILVKDTFEALWSLARFSRERFQSHIKIAALTGSVGKTTTKAALAHVLKDQGRVTASAKSLNTKLGVPLSLIRSPQNADYGVFEIGMSRKGEIAPLSKLVKPHVAVITMIGSAHISAFTSLEAIAHEKSEIINGLSQEGMVILNHDMPLFKEISERISHQKMTFGKDKDSDLRLIGVQPVDFGFLEVKAQFKGEKDPFTYVIQGIGEHFAYNTLGALLTAKALGADFEKSRKSLETFTPEVRRGQCQRLVRDGKEIVVLDESYNANPTSMRAALEALSYLPRWRGGRMVAVLGDMLDLGEKSEEFHRDLSHEIKKHQIEAVFTCGAGMEHLNKALPKEVQKIHVPESQDLFEKVITLLQNGDNIMVKGSFGMKMDAFIKTLKGE